MNRSEAAPAVLTGTAALAAVLWFGAFRLGGPSFWIKIALSAALLAGLALWLQSDIRSRFRLNQESILLGIGAAAALYFIFWLGKTVSTLIFPFAPGQIHGIYGIGHGFTAWQVALILFFITGPAEEIYWRGFLQRRLSERWGKPKGWLIATVLYTGVHLCTLNFMLIGAAAVAGVFWGLMYWRYDNLAANVVSHSLWTAVVFAVFPLT